MSMVSVIFKVYTEEGALDSVSNEIKEKLAPKDLKTEELAFGIKAIRVMFVFDNASQNSSMFEEKVRKISGVSEIEAEEETLI